MRRANPSLRIQQPTLYKRYLKQSTNMNVMAVMPQTTIMAFSTLPPKRVPTLSDGASSYTINGLLRVYAAV